MVKLSVYNVQINQVVMHFDYSVRLKTKMYGKTIIVKKRKKNINYQMFVMVPPRCLLLSSLLNGFNELIKIF